MALPNESVSKSSYLVGFLAVLVGLAAFKDTLAGIQIHIFSLDFSLLDVAIPMVLIMLLATYLSALAQFLANVSITSIPVSKYINIASNAMAILALIYPILFIALLGVLKLVEITVNNSDRIQDVISIIIAAFSGAFAALTAVNAAIKLNKIKQESELAKTLQEFTVRPLKRTNTPLDLLKNYEQVVGLIVRYLQLRGYGVGGRGLLVLARILQSKNVFDPSDVDRAAELNELRNNYAHGKRDLSARELRDALDKIALLESKVEQALYELNPDAPEDSDNKH
jgi:hypothetical protein